jgi:hypothetical protein
MGNNGNKGEVMTKGWQKVIEKWHERRGERQGTVLVLHHPQQVDITMVDAYTGRWQVTVPNNDLGEALGALVARGANMIDLVALPTSAPPIPRPPNPPPPPGHPLLAETMRSLSQIRVQVQIEGIHGAIDKMNAGGNY